MNIVQIRFTGSVVASLFSFDALNAICLLFILIDIDWGCDL